MTPKAYDEKKWRGLKNLQSALSRADLDDHHYGYSTAHYNKFESLSDLLYITLLVLDKVDIIPNSDIENTVKEMRNLAGELEYRADQLRGLSVQLKNEAERWAECNWRPLKE
jgi:hypothetical protein